MCKFSTSLAPPPAPEAGFEQLLDAELADVDDFNWFDAIEAIDDGELGLEGPVAASTSATGALRVPITGQQQQDVESSSAGVGALKPAASGSDNSSYDLVEMFKAQAEQQQQQAAVAASAPLAAAAAAAATALPSPPAVLPAFAFGAAPLAYGAALMQQPAMLCGVPAFAAAPAAMLAPASAYLAVAPAQPQQEQEHDDDDDGLDGMQDSAGTTPAAAAHPQQPRVRRANRSQAEIDAAVERIKQKRRESAQRSRARKNDYMRQLELENQALRDELGRLQAVVAAMQRGAYAHPTLVPLAAL